MMTGTLTTQHRDERDRMDRRQTREASSSWPLLDAHEVMPFLLAVDDWLTMPEGWTYYSPLVKPWRAKFITVKSYSVRSSLQSGYRQTTEYSSQIKMG